MPNILITGNGFDLRHCLPTMYKDFITILINLEHLTEFNFDSIYSLSSNYEQMLTKYNKEIIFDSAKILEIQDLLNSSLWFNFFKTELDIESWIDFEIKIEYVLKLIFSSTKFLQQKFFDKEPLKIGAVRYDSRVFDNKIEILEILNFFKIIRWENNTAELLLDENFFIQKYNYNIGVDTEKIAKYLYNEILKFKVIFNLYFENFVIPLYPHFEEEIDKFLFSKINYHFTFNYTPTLSKLYQNIPSTEFLHGKIGNSKNLVLGINDIPNDTINKIHYIPFTKYFQKLNENTDFYFLTQLSNRASSFTFFFYGHSLDISDGDYINEIFNFIDSINKGFRRKIIIILHRSEAKATLLTNLFNIRGKDDIVKKMKENILQFKLADSDELVRELKSDNGYLNYDPKGY